jgi:hypothetical protein
MMDRYDECRAILYRYYDGAIRPTTFDEVVARASVSCYFFGFIYNLFFFVFVFSVTILVTDDERPPGITRR